MAPIGFERRLRQSQKNYADQNVLADTNSGEEFGRKTNSSAEIPIKKSDLTGWNNVRVGKGKIGG